MTTSLAVVTGAASGIGLALTHELVSRLREPGVAQWMLDAWHRRVFDGNLTLKLSEMP